MFSTYDINYDEFKALINKFANELNFPFEEFFIEKEESKLESGMAFLHYNIKYDDKNKNLLRLFVEIAKNQNESKREKMYSLELGFSDTPATFYFRSPDMPSPLDRWLSNCLKTIHEYKRTPFDYYFHNFPYLNHGVEGASDPTAYLFKITLFGILKNDRVKQVWIARIQHISEGDLYRSFSYAILPYGSVYWLLFPDAVGLDSGGARGGYETIEKSIKEAQKRGKIKIIDIVSSLEEFKDKFKALYPKDFEPPYRENIYERVIRMKKNDAQLVVFFTEIQRIDEEIKKQEYMPALREMRALIEELCKYICQTNGIQIKADDPNINHLSSALLENKIIDHHILSWFNAFNSVANEAAHGIDSSKVFDMNHEIKNDLFETTIKLGHHLILQLFSKV